MQLLDRGQIGHLEQDTPFNHSWISYYSILLLLFMVERRLPSTAQD